MMEMIEFKVCNFVLERFGIDFLDKFYKVFVCGIVKLFFEEVELK